MHEHPLSRMPFFLVTPEEAARRVDVAVAHDAQGRPLGLTRPDWRRFFGHLSYAVGWRVELPGDSVSA